MTRTRVRFDLEGRLQGVGFRPLVYRFAGELGLSGWVQNTGQGVSLELEGEQTRIEEFESLLHANLPAAAYLRRVRKRGLSCRSEPGFRILEATPEADLRQATAEILPDLAMCPACAEELRDPLNRRYRYPFIQCTDCGPRYSILERLPMDRANTTMREFRLCPECLAEYRDPGNRRFHAQGICCASCGPSLSLRDPGGRTLAEKDAALLGAARALREGRILAILGVGGFHLFCDARRDNRVARLRSLKRREAKPFAVMAPGLEHVREICRVSAVEERLLLSQAAPIVLLERQELTSHRVSREVGPGTGLLGVMLPYTPLHQLLMQELGFFVVATSANLTDEPICSDPDEAILRLGVMADCFLIHNRKIASSVDDSVVREIAGTEVVVRAGRGYAPLVLTAPYFSSLPESPELLALGGQQKNTLALGSAGKLVLMPHLGDLAAVLVSEAYGRRVEQLRCSKRPREMRLICDLHPDYHSTHVAEAHDPLAIRIQHHEAHLLSCVAEHGIRGRAVGIAWDGTGYGPDGTIWGGEFFMGSERGFARVGHLRRFRLPGGEAAAREPWRSALGVLHEAGLPLMLPGRTELETRNLVSLLAKGVHSPLTSSAGRLFDAVAAILGLRDRCSYEGQAAMELEACAFRSDGRDSAYPVRLARGTERGALQILDWEPWVRGVIEDRERGWEAGRIAARFHRTLSQAIVEMTRRFGGVENARQVILSGGCFQNRLLSEGAITGLLKAGFAPYWNQRVPINDGGLSVGQLWGGYHVLVRSDSACIDLGGGPADPDGQSELRWSPQGDQPGLCARGSRG